MINVNTLKKAEPSGFRQEKMQLFLILLSLLIQLLEEDKSQGLREIFKTFQIDIMNFLKIKLNGNNELAAEIYQEAALAFIQYVNRKKIHFVDEHKLKNFIITIAMNKLYDQIRKNKLVYKHFKFFYNVKELEDCLSRFADPEASPEILTLSKVDRQRLEKVISLTMQGLAENHRQILTLKFIQDKSNIRIAEELKITVKAVESLVFRAKHAFKKLFKKYALRDKMIDITFFPGAGDK